jgi:hypothetical protein
LETISVRNCFSFFLHCDFIHRLLNFACSYFFTVIIFSVLNSHIACRMRGLGSMQNWCRVSHQVITPDQLEWFSFFGTNRSYKEVHNLDKWVHIFLLFVALLQNTATLETSILLNNGTESLCNIPVPILSVVVSKDFLGCGSEKIFCRILILVRFLRANVVDSDPKGYKTICPIRNSAWAYKKAIQYNTHSLG